MNSADADALAALAAEALRDAWALVAIGEVVKEVDEGKSEVALWESWH